MKKLNRGFTTKEKVLLVIMFLIIIGLLYYQLVDKPVRTSLEQAEVESNALESELLVARAKEQQLLRMQAEIDELIASGKVREMPSYNNAKAVNALLNDILGEMGYTITFSTVTRSGDQVRRKISVNFTAPNYDTVRQVMQELSESPYRCLVENVSCSIAISRYGKEVINTSLTATFYETMVGATTYSGVS